MSAPPSVPYKGQKYETIKKALRSKGDLFTDAEFPADTKSLFFSRVDPDIEWKRPKDLCEDPKLVVDGISCDDLQEGELGNTWFVSACSALARDPRLWNKVIPVLDEQEWQSEGGYAGIFHFQFWRYGQWLDVVIDDLLPTKDNKLLFCHSNTLNEFWSALLEKAYAKLYGNYESLSAGYTADALVDFTGGVAERLDIQKIDMQDPPVKERFFKDLMTAIEKNALVVCNILCSAEELGKETEHGLVKGHGYLVRQLLGIQVPKDLQARVGCDRLQLIRLVNPWGTREWTGPWGDDSTEWKALSEKDRESIGIQFEAEGDFWMSIDDFVKHFTHVDMCHFVNTAMFDMRKTWNECLLHGQWTKGPTDGPSDRSGGGESHPTFLQNPQYIFDTERPADNFLISLEQEDTPMEKQSEQKLLKIGFHIMQVEQNRIFRVHKPGVKVVATEHVGSRSVFERLMLKRGRYVIIPSTEAPGQTGVFLLRIYSMGTINVKTLTEDLPDNPTGCCAKPYSMVTQVNVVKAVGLAKSSNANTPTNPFVIVTCEEERVRSPWANRTEDPLWNFRAIFYRQKPSSSITVEVVNHKNSSDSSMGIAEFSLNGKKDTETLELSLVGNCKRDKGAKKSGKLTVEVTSSPDLMSL